MRKFGEMMIIAVFTALIGQIHFYPFGTDFRLTLGVVVFTFLILYFRVPVLGTAALSAFAVLCFRTGLDVAGGQVLWGHALERHFPAVVFYLVYGTITEQIGIREYIRKPVHFIILVSMADIVSNFFELLARKHIGSLPMESVMTTIAVVALLRAFIVLALFWLVATYNLLIVKEVHQKRYQDLLLLAAKLNSEILFLRKSTQDIESAMVKSYSIHSLAKGLPADAHPSLKGIGEASLSLAIEIHEIKKDYLRIVHSMERILPAEARSPQMSMQEILRTVREVYEGYLEDIGRPVRLTMRMQGNLEISRYYEVISMLNNLIHNAVEATESTEDPWVKVEAAVSGAELVIQVEDNGRGIEVPDRELIFEPGFTTKIDGETGELPTGLGLTHVRVLTEHLGGQVLLDPSPQPGTRFILKLPRMSLCQSEEGA